MKLRRSVFLRAFLAACLILFSIGPATAAKAAPTVDTWIQAASMANGRAYHTATLLQNGKVLVAGGYDYNTGNYLSSAELYDPVADSWSPAGNMSAARGHHSAALLPDGRVLVAGGTSFGMGGTLYLNSAELYDPATNTWSPAALMPEARTSYAAILLPTGKVLLTCG